MKRHVSMLEAGLVSDEDAGNDRASKIRKECNRILAHPVFRTSKRSGDFLLHIVDCALGGRSDRLKERSLGIDLFGRSPGYDTGEDSIVRVTANEVRKKLAQYYVEPGHESEIRIELRSGSYLPEFYVNGPDSEVKQTSRRSVSLRSGLIASLGLGVLAAAVFFGVLRRQPGNTVLEEFWAPILNSPKPIIICSASPSLYYLSPQLRGKYFATDAEYPFRSRYGPLPPDAVIRGRDTVYAPNKFVGIGDAVAVAKLYSFFSSHQRPCRIEIGNKTSFGEIRQASVVLVGGYTSNRWTFPMTNGLRFIFERKNGTLRVSDTVMRDRYWALSHFSLGEDVPEDYGVVSRLLAAKNGGSLVAAAGITQYGTQAAGEFLTNESKLAEALRDAPGNWQGKNVQIVLHTKVMDQTPGPSTIMAVYFW